MKTLIPRREGPWTEPETATARPAAKSGRNVAVLCGGLSLPTVWNEDEARGFDDVLAVNGAAFLFSCDYALMVDRPLVERLLASKWRPRRALVTYAAEYRRRLGHRKEMEGLTFLEIPSLGPAVKCYTFPRALRFAFTLCGPDGTIEVFGCDMSSGPVDAADIKGDHGAARWRAESDVLRSIWDGRIVAVHGLVDPRRLDYISGRSALWPS